MRRQEDFEREGFLCASMRSGFEGHVACVGAEGVGCLSLTKISLALNDVPGSGIVPLPVIMIYLRNASVDLRCPHSETSCLI